MGAPVTNKIKSYYGIINILVSALYVLEYKYVYVHYVVERYGYAGISYNPVNSDFLLLLIASIPIYFYKGMRTIGAALSFFIYIFVYIPFIVTDFLADFPLSIRITQCAVFLAIMILFFLTDNSELGANFFGNRKRHYSFAQYEILVWILIVICVFINRNNITFVNFLAEDNDLYELRLSQGLDVFGKFMTYILLWLSHALIPVLLVYYYNSKKIIKLILSVFAFLLMFMIDKQKITFVIPFAMLGILCLADRYRNIFVNYFHVFIIAILSGLSLITYVNVDRNEDSFSAQGLAILVIVRTQCIEGQQLDRYTHFFEMNNNPYTYYSHIGVINKISGAYPYKESIGQVVAGDGSNSNAVFLLMDGIAAAGILGCFLISIVFVALKLLLNSMGRLYDVPSLIVVFLFAIFSVVNTSLFTSFFSFGILVIYLTFLLFRFPDFNRQSS